MASARIQLERQCAVRSLESAVSREGDLVLAEILQGLRSDAEARRVESWAGTRATGFSR